MLSDRRLLLLGIGSPFGDDNLGWRMLDALQERPLDLPGWEVCWQKVDRPGPGLLDRLQGADAAVLIDAMWAGEGQAQVRLLAREQLDHLTSPTSTHALGVVETLALGERLQMLPERLHILGIAMGNGLSPENISEARVLLAGLFRQP